MNSIIVLQFNYWMLLYFEKLHSPYMYFEFEVALFNGTLDIRIQQNYIDKRTCLDKLGQHIQAKELHNKALKINPNYTANYKNSVALISCPNFNKILHLLQRCSSH